MIKTALEFTSMKNGLGIHYANAANRTVTVYDYVEGGNPINPVVVGCLMALQDNSAPITIGEGSCCEYEAIEKYKYQMDLACTNYELLALWHKSDAIIDSPVTASTLTKIFDVPSSVAINGGTARLGIVELVDLSSITVSLNTPTVLLALGTDYRILNGVIVLSPTTQVIAAAGEVGGITVTATKERTLTFSKDTISIVDKTIVVDYNIKGAKYRDVFPKTTLSSLPAVSSTLDQAGLTVSFSFVPVKDWQGVLMTSTYA